MATFVARATDPVPRTALPPEAGSRWGSAALPSDVRDAMTGSSWESGCPVGREVLRYVELTQHDSEGDVRQGRLVVHHRVVDDLEQIFATMFDEGFPLEQVAPAHAFDGDADEIMAANASHAFKCRQIAGGDSWSEHSFGTAIDLNPVQNPCETPTSATVRCCL